MDTESRIKQVIADELGLEISTVVSGASLANDLEADSLDIMTIAMELESDFNIDIMDEEIEKFRTVNDVVEAVTSRVK